MSSKILTLLCCVVLTATSIPAQRADLAGTSTLSLGRATDAYPMPFPSRGGDVDWGLALSGGGLRSAAFSIGAMKALYDLRILDDIDVISSVSGGGYASYWLYSRYENKDNGRFGERAFRDDIFPRNVCTLASKSEFFPFRRMIAAAFSTRSKAFRKYRDSIEASFGTVDVRACDVRERCYPSMRKLRALLPDINAKRAPYFIINTTIESGETRDGKLRKIEKTFELAPTYRGSDALGYSDWSQPDANIATWADAVAISGAGIRFKLSRTIDNHSSRLDEDDIDLADGGLSENLGAMPLIRRGIRKIIIVDAENDPGYKFESYMRLKNYLATEKIDLAVGMIDKFLANKKILGPRFTQAAVAIGSAKAMHGYDGPPVGSEIYYIKMSRPATIFPPGWQTSTKILEEYRRRFRPASCPTGQMERIDRATLTRDMLGYANFLNKEWPWGKFFAFLPWINYNFPQITTVDQTFYGNQLEAFIGLGYLETCEMS